MKLDTCALAGKRCHCEENRYEMYTYCKRSCGYCGQERLRKYSMTIVNETAAVFLVPVVAFSSVYNIEPVG